MTMLMERPVAERQRSVTPDEFRPDRGADGEVWHGGEVGRKMARGFALLATVKIAVGVHRLDPWFLKRFDWWTPEMANGVIDAHPKLATDEMIRQAWPTLPGEE